MYCEFRDGPNHYFGDCTPVGSFFSTLRFRVGFVRSINIVIIQSRQRQTLHGCQIYSCFAGSLFFLFFSFNKADIIKFWLFRHTSGRHALICFRRRQFSFARGILIALSVTILIQRSIGYLSWDQLFW